VTRVMTVSRMARVSAAAVLLVIAVVPVRAASEDQAAAMALAEASRFRAEFGLRSDAAYVAETARSERVSEAWGIALTAQEEAELNRRTRIANSLDALTKYAATIPDLGGVFLDQHAGGEVVVTIAGDPDPHRPALSRRLPAGASLRVERVSHRLADLDAAHNAIIADAAALQAEGITVSSVTTDESANLLLVTVNPLTPENESLLRARYGEFVVVQGGGEGTLTHTGCYSRTHCYGPPLRAGISVNPSGCSLGFVVQQSGVTRILTAGHGGCGDFGGLASHDGFTFGAIQTRSWFGGDTWETADAATIGNLTAAQDDNWLYTCAGCALAISGAQSMFEPENIPVCISARNTEAVRCGTMINKNASILYPEGWLRQQREATYAVYNLDSGGATYAGSTAYGIQSSCIDRTGDGICTFGDTPDNALYSQIGHIFQDLAPIAIYTGN
jgi:hypothetical protein